MASKPTSKIININTDIKTVFKHYLFITKPLNKLRPKEIDVLSLLLYYNYLETPNFKRDEDRWRRVFDYSTKLLIREELQMEDYTLQNVLSSLRKKKVIKDNIIMDYYIPKVDPKNNFQLIFNFNVKHG